MGGSIWAPALVALIGVGATIFDYELPIESPSFLYGGLATIMSASLAALRPAPSESPLFQYTLLIVSLRIAGTVPRFLVYTKDVRRDGEVTCIPTHMPQFL